MISSPIKSTNTINLYGVINSKGSSKPIKTKKRIAFKRSFPSRQQWQRFRPWQPIKDTIGQSTLDECI